MVEIMKIRLLVGLALAMCPLAAFAQTSGSTTSKAPDGNTILYKIAKLESIKFVAPLLLKKSQMNSILTGIEKCQATQKTILESDTKELAKLEAKLDKAIADGVENGGYPKRELQVEVVKVQDALLIRRRMAVNEMTDSLYEVCKKTLNEGQIAVMKNTLNLKELDPTLNPDKVTDEQKVKFYIQRVLLNDVTYDVLKDMYKHAHEGA